MKPPVDPERLRREFPGLTDDDLAAYAAVTKQVLADPAAKGRILRRILEAARAAREKEGTGTALRKDEALALRYAQALEKMQRPIAPRRRERG